MIVQSEQQYDRLIEIACNYIRSQFDSAPAYMASVYIKEATDLGLPITFINELKNDAKDGK